MTISTEQTRLMHDAYSKLVANERIALPYSMSLHFRWEMWMAKGFTTEDLALVINYLRARIRAGKRELECLDLRNLLSSVDDFSCTLSMARAKARQPRVEPDRESVLRSASRPEKAPVGMARSAKEVLERPKLATMLKEWREKNL